VTQVEKRSSAWARIRRDVLLLCSFVLILELLCRIPPVRAALAERLDPYEVLLWYTPAVPVYQKALLAKPGDDVWLLGSSYMMTAFDPTQMQPKLPTDLTVQSYGFSGMRNLDAMSHMVDWLLTYDQPRYVVLGVNLRNFTPAAGDRVRAQDSPLENIFVYTDSIDDVIAGFLYRNSLLYRYGILARNATFIPLEDTAYPAVEAGGYTRVTGQLEDCAAVYNANGSGVAMADGLARLDTLIDTIHEHSIPVMVVNIAMPVCALENFQSFAHYTESYLDVLSAHLTERGVPFHALDPRFYAEYPLDDHGRYYDDTGHANADGAALYSAWTADFIAAWVAAEA
jgi:hypothetical protein